jgi:3-methyl-2-oxobutanoate hydroxymethyltransferase
MSQSNSAADRPRLYGGDATKRITLQDLAAAKERHERWPMLTAYDAVMARIFDEAGVPVLLVGDSAANVVYGYDTTIPVTMNELVPLVGAVARATRRALVVADMPFGSYQSGPEQALAEAARFLKEGGAQAVKLEGGDRVLPQVEALVGAGIPVMGHLGLTPQSVNALGGYRVQGRGGAGERLIRDAKNLESAGAFAIVLEVVPAELAQRVTDTLSIPTIGIGAGNGCDAQVNVWQDLLGLTAGPRPKFVRPYADLRSVVSGAVREWSQDVVSGSYPGAEHSYT